jgi:hypothetical protein
MPSGTLNDDIDLCIAALHAVKVIAAGHGFQSPGFQKAVDDVANMLEKNVGGHPREPRRAIAAALRNCFVASPSGTSAPPQQGP